MSSVKTEWTKVKVSDGTEIGLFVARPEAPGPHPGILVIQEIFGVNNHIQNVTRRLAAEGLVAVAPDLFHRSAPGIQLKYDQMQEGYGYMQAMRDEGTSTDLHAAHEYLAHNVDGAAVGSIGFCMGGRLSLIANASLPIRASVSYYAGGLANEIEKRVDTIHGPALFFWGGKDAHIGPEQVEKVESTMRKAKKPFVNVVFSEADHGFNCDERGSFNADAASQAWALTRAFLATHLKLR